MKANESIKPDVSPRRPQPSEAFTQDSRFPHPAGTSGMNTCNICPVSLLQSHVEVNLRTVPHRTSFRHPKKKKEPVTSNFFKIQA